MQRAAGASIRRRRGISTSRSSRDARARGDAAARSARRSTRSTASTAPTASSRSTPTSSAAGRARALRARLRPRAGAMPRQTMNRLYVVETAPSNTGAMADHRLPLRPAEVARVRARASRAGSASAVRAPQRHGGARALIDAVVRGSAASTRAAASSSPAMAAAGRARAGARDQRSARQRRHDRASTPSRSPPQPVDQAQSLRELVDGDGRRAGRAAGDPRRQPGLRRAGRPRVRRARSAKVGTRIHYGLYDDETAELSHWHVPATHYLESWSDARAYDGTATILQPLIAPLYDGQDGARGAVGAARRAATRRATTSCARTGSAWAARRRPTSSALAQGRARRRRRRLGAAAPCGRTGRARPARVDRRRCCRRRRAAGRRARARLPPRSDVYDGRFANNGWLQELPKPLTRLTWDNAALIAPATAERLGLGNERRRRARRSTAARVRAPVWIVPGQAPDVVTVHLGYGRTRAGRVGNGVGFDAYACAPATARGARPASSAAHDRRATITLACTQHHHSMEGRDLARVGTRRASTAPIPHFAATAGHARASRCTRRYKYEGYAWGMAIDLNACVGCNACVVACQAENNIPVVGKDQVARGREMQWIRIDRYYEGDLDNPADRTTSRCSACTARRRRARSSARSTRPCTTTKA